MRVTIGGGLAASGDSLDDLAGGLASGDSTDDDDLMAGLEDDDDDDLGLDDFDSDDSSNHSDV